MTEDPFKCRNCEATLGTIVGGAVLVIADKVAIISVVKLRCFLCRRSTTFRPSRAAGDSTIENVLTIDPTDAGAAVQR